jgi:hypothetical protein
MAGVVSSSETISAMVLFISVADVSSRPSYNFASHPLYVPAIQHLAYQQSKTLKKIKIQPQYSQYSFIYIKENTCQKNCSFQYKTTTIL